MIYTVTLNPSLDYIMDFDSFSQGEINRSSSERLTFGGKGLNVSYVLNQLGIDNMALAFKAGETGEMLERLAAKSGIKTDFISLRSGTSRINVKLRYGGETEANGRGAQIDEEAVRSLRKRLSLLKKCDTLALCGSLPNGAPSDLYKTILDDIKDAGVRTIVDTSGDALIHAVEGKPFLIKPNSDELSQIFSTDCTSVQQITACAKQLLEKGAENILVSRGKNGAVFIDKGGKTTEISAPKIDAVGTTGAGDSMVAGFIAGLDRGLKYALTLATACGSAAAKQGRLASADEIKQMLRIIG